MKKILFIFLLGIISFGFTACDENSTFLEENPTDNNLFYPQIVKINVEEGFGETVGDILRWELNFDSKATVASLDVLQVVGEDTTVYSSTPYGDAKVGYSNTSFTDSLVMTYTVPTLLAGESVKVLTRIVNVNTLFKISSVDSFDVPE